MMKRLLIAICLLMAGAVGATAVTFNVTTGMIDNSLDRSLPTTNLGTYTQLWLVAISGDSTDGRVHIGDPSIDDALTALGTIVVDSAYLIYTRDRIYNSSGDSVFVWPVAVLADRDWVETGETWTRWKVGSNWSVPGGDSIVSIAKIDTLTSHTNDITDTIIIKRGVLGGTAFLDASKTSTGNTGIILMCRQNQIGADGKVGVVDIYSTEEATETTKRPSLVYFYTAGEAGPVTKKLGAVKVGNAKI